ncbi:GID complex subunit containing RING finger motif [Entomophthora muscae]|uniref:GID complex subunit containing RING finger motif n=1 Tax=Entomophthora muscae TaxID=34485 RepID=A0ACC2S9D2_9FUNG|nr:GID complex subunit containing RING finger motif [Entomophthora muscae]
MNKLAHEPYIQLEQPFIKVPAEQLKKSYQAYQRLLDRNVKILQHGDSQLTKHHESGKLTPTDMAAKYDTILNHLRGFQEKLKAGKESELCYINRLGLRLSHLEEFEKIPSQNTPEFERWNRCRLDRVTLDFLLRHGHHATARQLARQNELEEMADFELFEQDALIEAELWEGKCIKALLWCAENKTSLKKLKSTLEFNLRLQEFVELARIFEYKSAIEHSQKYLAPYMEFHSLEIRQALTLLAFPPTTTCGPYMQLYSADRWRELVAEFRKDSFALHSLPAQPALSLVLQAGLSALKTPQCTIPSCQSTNCPVCQPDTFGALAIPLPFSHHTNSTIVCRITGKLMDESNPPLVLPNGFVYSTKAVHDQINTSGYFHDPQSGSNFTLDQIKKVYIL